MRKLDLKRLFYKNYMTAKQEAIATQIREQQKDHTPLNFDIFEMGIKWFDSGLSLDDADDELKNDSSFIKGFNKGKMLKYIEESLYALGIEFYNDGLSIDEIPEMYKNNPRVIQGYENSRKSNNK
jgi:hypothetical protein